jgi:hypothetical protein
MHSLSRFMIVLLFDGTRVTTQAKRGFWGRHSSCHLESLIGITDKKLNPNVA